MILHEVIFDILEITGFVGAILNKSNVWDVEIPSAA